MVAHILFIILILLILVLCKSLAFGQTSLSSPHRTVFRIERQVLPVLWNDLPKMKPESQASLLFYLLNPPKLDYYHPFYMQSETKNQPLRKSIAHQPHSDNKITHGFFMEVYCAFVLPWYMLILLSVGYILIGCLIVKAIQIIHLLIQGKLFAYKPWNPPSSEERWNSLITKLNEIWDVIDKKDKEDKESDQKQEALAVSVTEMKHQKID